MSFLDPILGPLLTMNPLFAIVLVSLVLSIAITLIYKFTTDQSQMKTLRDNLKKHQDEMKKHRDNPDKLMKIQSKAMSANMEYMKLSMKPTLFTIIPIMIIFAWLGAHFGFEPILPGEEFKIKAEVEEAYSGMVELIVPEGLTLLSNNATQPINGLSNWKLKGEEGVYLVTIKADNWEQQKKLIVSNINYETPEQEYKEGAIKKVTVGNTKIQPFHGTPIEKVPWIGNFGWLGTYIIFSLIFSMSLRKAMNLN